MRSDLLSRLAATAMSLCAATCLFVSAHALLGHPAAVAPGAKTSTTA